MLSFVNMKEGCHDKYLKIKVFKVLIVNVFLKIFFGVPHLATFIFLFFFNEPELGVGIDPGMALTRHFLLALDRDWTHDLLIVIQVLFSPFIVNVHVDGILKNVLINKFCVDEILKVEVLIVKIHVDEIIKV